ncbi:hypothetical protein D6810_00795 [Candidatus Dojkabacteria bacterium]|uniref:Uncharacterized protein n=1 Tax=Candidatus Dojkabacteria bacterium TaxID=2099670 RepID=A0A3M0Z359_9BACT|nr:MAG: hypothetical protein D6810_00795 [Candidatus Dojkabacteria bacterium]
MLTDNLPKIYLIYPCVYLCQKKREYKKVAVELSALLLTKKKEKCVEILPALMFQLKWIWLNQKM